MEIIDKLKMLIIDSFLKTEKYPKKETILKSIPISGYKLKILQRQLENEGFLIRHYNDYILSNDSSKSPTITFSRPEVLISPAPPKVKRFKITLKSDISIIFIKLTMGIIGTSAAYMSAYYTVLWLDEFLPLTQSIILSGSVVLFSVIAFQMILIFKKKNLILMAFIFAFLWSIAALFSMSSTIAGLYNKRIAVENQFNQANFSNTYKRNEYAIYTINENNLSNSIEMKQKEYDIYQKEWLKNPISNELAHKKMIACENRLNDLQDELKLNNDKKIDYLKKAHSAGMTDETKIEKPNFYQFLASGPFKKIMSANTIAFLLSVFPAIFIDIIAPLALAVLLFL